MAVDITTTGTAATGGGDTPPPARAARSSRVTALVLLRDQGMVALFVLLVAGFALLEGTVFFSWTNAMLIVGAAAITAVFAAGVAFGVFSGAIDLSVPGTAALAGVVGAKLITGGGSLAVGVLAALAVGVVAGLANGLIVRRGLNPLVVTIAMLSVTSGLAAVVSDGVPISGLTQLGWIGADTWHQVPTVAFFVGGLYLVGWLFLTRTRDGARLLAVGANAEAVRRVGIRADAYKVLGFVLSGVCAAFGGLIVAATITQATSDAGASILFAALTAVALSGMPLSGGRGSLPRVLVGALIIATINNGLVIKGVQPFWGTVCTGLLLIGALAAEHGLSRAVATQIVKSEGSRS